MLDVTRVHNYVHVGYKFISESSKHSNLQKSLSWGSWLHININTIKNLGHIFISGVYSPNSMKFGMKVGLWTLITGKLLWSCYLGNGCHGDKKLYKSSVMAHFGIAFEYEKDRKKILRYVLPWKQTCCHSNQYEY